MLSIVSAEWLAHHLDDRNVVIADCRFSLADASLGRQQYEAGHIPGAYYFDLNQDLSSPVQQHGGRHPLPEPEVLAAKLAQAGISADTFVVAYDNSRLAFAARFWWLLRYLGHDRVAVLDGGYQGWLNAKYSHTTIIPPQRSGEFLVNLQRDRVVNIEQVKARSNDAMLIDSREPERYRGEREPIDPIAGHIPGAMNYPWQEATQADGYLRPIAEQQQRWSTVLSTSELMVYCGSGVTACVNLLSLELAGRKAKLYAGSWSDWCSYLLEVSN
ncbi:sulfurtransferase [Microcoleus sp. FACHB-1515]|uniref:rhodanese-like domain-containing protein n=1 Tax=Cyanophyceae TaxID=3028117 RepID=UPI0016878425|nr:sulfurtransferase [Microcoleus sp. FACHB-1515]MBD2089660.1 sulfurtransferase [Microcoleus sp. FACHB-1515]